MYILPIQNPRGCAYKRIILLWYADIVRGPIQMAFISTHFAGDACARFSRILIDDVLGVDVTLLLG